MVKKLRIVIDNEAKKSLRQAYQSIKKDSLSNAEKVRKKILSSIKALQKIQSVTHPINSEKTMTAILERMRFISTGLPTTLVMMRFTLSVSAMQK